MLDIATLQIHTLIKWELIFKFECQKDNNK